MSLLEITKELCRQHRIVPSRSKGQNFLIDDQAYEAMISAAELKPTDQVLEAGPGLGFLTERLAKKVQHVYAVELDDKLAAALPSRLSEEGIVNVTVYNEDVLNFTGRFANDLRAGGSFCVVSNLPYNISSYFLRKYISGNEGRLMPERLTLMLQKEVGERLTATAGDMSLLAVSAQFYTRPEIAGLVPAESFWPAPKIGSAIVTFKRREDYAQILKMSGYQEKDFFRLVKIGFSARRKMLKANLAAGLRLGVTETALILESAGIAASARAQELGIKEWLKLIVAIGKFVV